MTEEIREAVGDDIYDDVKEYADAYCGGDIQAFVIAVLREAIGLGLSKDVERRA